VLKPGAQLINFALDAASTREYVNKRKTISMVAMNEMDTWVPCIALPSSFASAGVNRMALCYE
jgi:hypothetical protein